MRYIRIAGEVLRKNGKKKALEEKQDKKKSSIVYEDGSQCSHCVYGNTWYYEISAYRSVR
ncbi:hypothetical protein MOB1_07640 [Faecalimonas mobilis]